MRRRYLVTPGSYTKYSPAGTFVSGGSACPPAGGSTSALNAGRARLPDTPSVGSSSNFLCPTALTLPSASTTSEPYLSHRAGTSTSCSSPPPLQPPHQDVCRLGPALFTAAAETTDIFSNDHITLWGCPVTLFSGKGQQFTSELAAIVYDCRGVDKVKHQRKPPLHRRSRQPCVGPDYLYRRRRTANRLGRAADEDGTPLRDKVRIRQRWAGVFCQLRSQKQLTLDPTIIELPLKRAFARSLGNEAAIYGRDDGGDPGYAGVKRGRVRLSLG